MSLILQSSGGGQVTIQEPTTASNFTLDLPAVSGTFLTNKSTGTVLQVVSTTKVDGFTTTSTSPVDITGLSVNITPSSATSKILVFAQIFGGGDAATALYLNLVRNSTALAQGTVGTFFNSTVGSFLGSPNYYTAYPIVFLDSPATTLSTTYKIQTFAPAGTVAINRRVSDLVIGGSSTITVMEIAA
jgi:hypothetical protein